MWVSLLCAFHVLDVEFHYLPAPGPVYIVVKTTTVVPHMVECFIVVNVQRLYTFAMCLKLSF